MQHSEIIQAIQKLIPETLEKGPEPVLLKYANDNNLAPAQLERVAQIYNTALTINFLEKAANRGGSFKLVEVPDLLQSYTAPGKKVAREGSVPDDWKLWLGAASDEGATMPHLINLKRNTETVEWSFKTASEQLYPEKTPESFYEGVRKEAADKFEFETVEQIISNSEERFRKIASRIEDLIRIEGVPFADLEKEARMLHADTAKEAADSLCRYFDQRHIPYTRYDGDLGGRIIRDEWNTADLFKDAAECLGEIRAAKSYMAHLKEAAGPPSSTPPGGQPSFESHGGGPERPGGQQQRRWKPGGGREQRHKPREEAFANASGGPENYKRQKGFTSSWDADVNEARKLMPKEPEDKTDYKEIGRDMTGLVGDTAKGLGAMFNPETYGSKGLNAQWDALRSKTNKPQKLIDRGVDDTRRVTTLQRLMLTDPIISEADPQMVVDLANTLAKASPDVAADGNLMRMALREAIQYEAIPLHTFKDLVEIHERRQKGQESLDKNIEKRYEL